MYRIQQMRVKVKTKLFWATSRSDLQETPRTESSILYDGPVIQIRITESRTKFENSEVLCFADVFEVFDVAAYLERVLEGVSGLNDKVRRVIHSNQSEKGRVCHIVVPEQKQQTLEV